MAETTHAGTQASGGAHQGGHGSFPPFDSSTFSSQLIWFAIAFGALYLLMSRVALPRVTSILSEREGRLSRDLAEANRLKTETDAAIASYEKALADARTKAQSIAADNRDRLAAESDAKRKAVEADLAQRLLAAEEAIARSRADAMGNIHDIAVDATAAIVQQLIGKAPARSEIDQALVKVMGP